MPERCFKFLFECGQKKCLTDEIPNALAREYWERCDAEHAAPGAESFAHFMARAREAIERLAARRERRVFVFCHGHLMGAVAWLLLSQAAAVDAAAMRRFLNFTRGRPVANCAISVLHFHADGARSLGGLWVPDGVESEAS